MDNRKITSRIHWDFNGPITIPFNFSFVHQYVNVSLYELATAFTDLTAVAPHQLHISIVLAVEL